MTPQQVLKLRLAERRNKKRRMLTAAPDQFLLLSDSLILLNIEISALRDKIRRAKFKIALTYNQANAQSKVACALYESASHAVAYLKTNGHAKDLAWAKEHLEVCWARLSDARKNRAYVLSKVSHVGKNNITIIDDAEKAIELP